ncbi:hypothetical protein ACHAXT_011523 [Thalassiosira profunda]
MQTPAKAAATAVGAAPPDSAQARRREIAHFSSMVRSSSDESESLDDDRRSFVELDDEEPSGLLIDDETSGLLICDAPLGDLRLDEEEAGGHASASSEDDDLRRRRGCCQSLIARIRANPSLSIATIAMGILTAGIWTDRRFHFIGIGSDRNSSNGTSGPNLHHKHKGKSKTELGPKSYPAFPAKALLGIAIQKPQKVTQAPIDLEPPYDPTDFRYEKLGRNRTLLYWDEVVDAIEQSQDVLEDGSEPVPSSDALVDLWTNLSYWGPCYPRAISAEDSHHRTVRVKKGLRSKSKHARNNWTYIVQSNSEQIADEASIEYPVYKKSYRSQTASEENLEGVCRPGFLIIGQGKCGTSSLYHYLTGHPRVLPAKEKQIHYFRYHKSKPLRWYYSHFPTIESFLGRGALMTGEASPGYLPYPEVVEAVAKRLTPNWKPSSVDGVVGNGADAWKQHVRSLPKIIAIVRDPITRAISSYKYNYIEPAMRILRAGRGISVSGKAIPGKKSESYYRKHHLFTFEELAYAELAELRECLGPGGKGEMYSQKVHGSQSEMFFFESIERRTNGGSDDPPLIHLDGACYTDTRNNNVPRAQWKDLAAEHPDKILRLPNLQLTQSIVGRGIYALPLEWWYEVFSNAAANKEDRIHVVCTEDMATTPNEAMDDVTEFLGLPEFDFANVTNVGRYNVGGHRGYDTITKSLDDGDGHEDTSDTLPPKRRLPEASDDELVAVSDALMNELLHFYRPYNERLFDLIGKRCPWKETSENQRHL